MLSWRREGRSAGIHRGRAASLLTISALGGRLAWAAPDGAEGPGTSYVPKVKVCFLRRKGEYGMRWPGQIYDGEAARKKYLDEIAAAGKKLNLTLSTREVPIYSEAEGDAWIAEAVAEKPDGLAPGRPGSPGPHLADDPQGRRREDSRGRLLADRHFVQHPGQHGRPVGQAGLLRRLDRRLPPGPLGHEDAPRGREDRPLAVPRDRRRRPSRRGHAPRRHHARGTCPASTFLEEYEKTPVDDGVRRMAKELIDGARERQSATDEDVLNGIKSYLVAQRMMAREKADAITMDCLGALGHTKVSLPCIAWSRLNDDAIPAACEADLGAVASQMLVQNLFDRPGFQQDPVAETARDAIVGAHCSCPTRLNGFAEPPEPYDILPHHGARDATRRTLWKEGQRVTTVDVLPGTDAEPTRVLVDEGTVLENVSSPPSGGCVVSVMVKFDSRGDVLAYPGFHQVFFYGEHKKAVVQFCRLFGLEPAVVI